MISQPGEHGGVTIGEFVAHALLCPSGARSSEHALCPSLELLDPAGQHRERLGNLPNRERLESVCDPPECGDQPSALGFEPRIDSVKIEIKVTYSAPPSALCVGSRD